MRGEKYRAASAEAEIHEIARITKIAIQRIESRCLLLDAAMRVIMKHDLLSEFSHELNNPPASQEEAA